ncbi:MAG: deoxyribose-phosphate aldolase [Planctomycetota bacterium]|jgi:deoxyribose-phosphate aldolase
MRTRTVDTDMVRQRAVFFTRRSIKTTAKIEGLRLALSMLDLTTLEGADTPEKVRSLCRKAIRPYEGAIDPPLPSVAAVCVYPALVPVAKETLAGTNVRVASVATAFPSGQYPIDVRLDDVRRAVEAGADEIDMVINRGAFLAGKYDMVRDEIRRTREACAGAALKIILETGELGSYDRVRRASDLAIEAGTTGHAPADGSLFIKTSTGKISPAATMPVSLVMLEAIRDHFLATGQRVGFKPAGGIRKAKQSLHYLVMVKETLGDGWLTPQLLRFGASGLTNDLLRQIVKTLEGHYMAGYDFSVV